VPRQDANWLGQFVDTQGAEPADRDPAWDAADVGDEIRDAAEGGAEDDGADDGADADVSGAFILAVVSLDNDALVPWPLVATRPAETPTPTVTVPTTTRVARFHFRGLFAVGRFRI
jgi:hypothetical protein